MCRPPHPTHPTSAHSRHHPPPPVGSHSSSYPVSVWQTSYFPSFQRLKKTILWAVGMSPKYSCYNLSSPLSFHLLSPWNQSVLWKLLECLRWVCQEENAIVYFIFFQEKEIYILNFVILPPVSWRHSVLSVSMFQGRRSSASLPQNNG